MNINEMKILSVFNETNPLLTIKEYTESFSLNIDRFTQTKEALLSSKNIKYDLLIVEHTPSKLDGVEFLKAFRHLHRETPVLILIESNDISLQEKAIKQGAFDVVCKPLSPVLFQAKVQNVLTQTKAKTLVDNRAIHLQDEIQNATKVLKNSEYELLEILGKTTN
ncbi:MAG: response regulator, partial [Sulfurimonas sp.]|nr:response regulator [Sulfurimonas sp.]